METVYRTKRTNNRTKNDSPPSETTYNEAEYTIVKPRDSTWLYYMEQEYLLVFKKEFLDKSHWWMFGTPMTVKSFRDKFNVDESNKKTFIFNEAHTPQYPRGGPRYFYFKDVLSLDKYPTLKHLLRFTMEDLENGNVVVYLKNDFKEPERQLQYWIEQRQAKRDYIEEKNEKPPPGYEYISIDDCIVGSRYLVRVKANNDKLNNGECKMKHLKYSGVSRSTNEYVGEDGRQQPLLKFTDEGGQEISLSFDNDVAGIYKKNSISIRWDYKCPDQTAGGRKRRKSRKAKRHNRKSRRKSRSRK